MDYAAAREVFFQPGPDDAPPPPVAGAAPARRLRDALEPVAMHAVWSPAVNERLAGFGLNFLTGYVLGRAAALGDVPAGVVVATFAVFEPGALAGLYTEGRSKVGLDELVAVRDATTAASLRQTLADADEAEVDRVARVLRRAVDAVDGTGRPLFSALREASEPDDPFGRLWRATDLVREHRGDGHVAACVAAGLNPVAMGLLMELWLGYPAFAYSGTRAWPQERLDAGLAALEADGLAADGAITDAGRELRDGIERATDAAQQQLIGELGAELDPVAGQLADWSDTCVAAGVFPPDVRKRAAG